MKAGVILTMEFELPYKEEKFGGIIDYMDREEVKEDTQSYSNYIEYMDAESRKNLNDVGSHEVKLFSKDKNNLTEEDKELCKNLFNMAQEKESVLWKGVYSFDTEYLKKLNLLSEDGKLNEGKIFDGVRKGIEELVEKEKLGNPVWTGEIHYNTDNFHVHFSMVELTQTKQISKGKSEKENKKEAKLKVSNMRKAKSKLANSLTNRTKEFEAINNIIREKINNKKKDVDTHKDKEMKKRFIEIMRYLPEDKTYWQYGYNKINHVKPKIDELSKYYIENYCKDDFKELTQKLDEENNHYKKVYGESKEKKKDYKEKKIEELYTRMGNTFLREMRNYAKEEERKLRTIKKQENNSRDRINVTKDTINRIKKALKNDIQHIKNKESYKKLQKEIEKDFELD